MRFHAHALMRFRYPHMHICLYVHYIYICRYFLFKLQYDWWGYWHLICFEFPGASHANQNQLLLSTEVTVPRSKFETVTQVYRKNINAKLLHLYYFPHQPQLSEEVTVPQSELEIRFKIPELVLERKQGWSSIKDKNSFVKTLIFFLYLQCPWMLV